MTCKWLRELRTKTIASAHQGSDLEGGTTGEAVGGRRYSEDNVAALRGFCGVIDVARIPNSWDKFQHSKELLSHRHHIRTSMEKWARQFGYEIDKAPFFTEQTIKDIVGLQFNPGEGVAHFSSAQRGISILTCRPKSAVEVEQIKGDEEAHRAKAHIIQYTEYRRRQRNPPSPPRTHTSS